ncbi:hypothetical protein SAMN05192575_10733 [Nocardioides alpinus]|uniref:Glycoprotein n=1 Tax=Nocardioides alpinus TaxID=748909 RepID=A0A1I0ZZ41_9ACTN|nr:DUF6049 family protein [Nocardioides alpinus]PKH42256.1 hypothetical protein CXG46_07260 [Nocardioides alpinus]SFB30622.1 hypothetical protein SAMN05192575_10733 [Nocardioides alpinus]
MPRPSVIRAALAGILALGTACGAALAPATAAPAEDPDPLLVHIDTITPVLPRNGDVEITGTVTNVSDDTFTRVNLHAFSSQTPILDAGTLAESADIDPTASVGERVTTPGTFDTVDVLVPGASATFADSVPVELLGIPDEEGVYWIGIHALGDTETVPRDEFADGRARTFIPARPSADDDDPQEAAVILPVRNRVWFDGEGKVGGTERWARRLEEGGSLDGILDMADSAGSTPYSWLVDPAVLVAILRLSRGNAPRSLDPDPAIPEQAATPTETPTDGETTEPSETLTPAVPEATEEQSEEEQVLAAAAAAWLARFDALVGSSPVLTLPYGDLDVSAAVRNQPERYAEALGRSTEVMDALGLPSDLAVAPTSDLLSPEAIAATPDDVTLLLGDNAFAFPPDSPHSVVRLLGHKVIVTSTGAEAGGPGPTAASDPLALRQRLLSEAALRLVNGDTAPLVVTLPTVWRGEDAEVFFDELAQPWLDIIPVSTVASRSAVGVPATNLAYTETDQEEELDGANFTAATRATDAAGLVEDVLTLQTTVQAQVRDEVLVTLSEQHRKAPRLALVAAGRIADSLRGELAKIEIEAPTSVTLSSDSGKLGTTLVNGLDQPVTVQVAATTDGQLTLTGDTVRQLGPRTRSVVRFEATTTQPGLHRVRLTVTSIDGVPLGSAEELPIRAARVSALIWIVMAVGALVLFGMIGYRLPGQIRARRRELAAQQQADADAEEETAEAEATEAAPGGTTDPGPTGTALVPERT